MKKETQDKEISLLHWKIINTFFILRIRPFYKGIKCAYNTWRDT